MKLQLLLLVCLFALSSALAARKPSRLASGLSSSSRINNFGLTARDDDFHTCYRGYCFKCDEDERCVHELDCYDLYDFDDDFEQKSCLRGYCCEFTGDRCRYNDCHDDDDDD